ncbi:MAG: hypothetical protein HOW97_29140 [Catenulispora sp.]|nr:hypothetical protein [Catenulispora sp.]
MTAAAAVALAGVPVAAPARADVPIGEILGDVSTVTSYVKTAQSLYGLFNQYVLGNSPTTLDQIKALIVSSQQQIVTQIDAIATANVNSEAKQTVEQFENISSMTPDQLAAFVSLAVKTVEDAGSDLVAEKTAAAQDELGFDLNIVGPIALAASAKAGQATDILTTDIIQADKTVLQKLAPRCATFPIDLQDEGSVLSQGHCWNYHVAADFPTGHYAQVPENFALHDVGNNGFTVHGDYNGFDYTAPAVTDYSQAIAAAMADTSYPIAQVAILSLSPAVASQAPVSAITETLGGRQSVFGTSGFGGLWQGALVPNPAAGAGRYGIGWFPEFTGTPPQLKSVTSAQNSDGRAEVFALDRLGQIWHTWQTRPGDDTSWSLWANMSGNLTSVSVARNHNGTLQLFGSGPDGVTYTRSQILGGDYVDAQDFPTPAVDAWTDWTAMTDGWTSQDVAVTDLAGRIELFGIGADHAIWHREQQTWDATNPNTPGGWSSWSHVPAGPADARELAVAANAAGKIFLASIGSGDQVSDVLKIDDRGRDTDYTAWGHLSGPIHHLAMAGLTQAPGSIQLFGLNAAGDTFTDSVDGVATGSPAVPDTDTGWVKVSGELAPFPS